jgi:hypothetical protein
MVVPETAPRRLGTYDMETVITRLACFQFEMLRAGFLVGGAIATGTIVVSIDAVCGKGLREAVRVGSGAGRLPRIVLAPSAERLYLGLNLVRDSMSLSGLSGSLVVDSDSQVFVNYLEKMIFLLGDEVGPFRRELLMHRRAVLRARLRSPENRLSTSSVRWLGDHHDWFCAERGLLRARVAARLDRKQAGRRNMTAWSCT